VAEPFLLEPPFLPDRLGVYGNFVPDFLEDLYPDFLDDDFLMLFVTEDLTGVYFMGVTFEALFFSSLRGVLDLLLDEAFFTDDWCPDFTILLYNNYKIYHLSFTI
jgi:hypothetical protein